MKHLLYALLILTGIGLVAVPATDAQVKEKKVVKALKGAWLGVSIKDVEEDLKADEKLKVDKGAFVDDVVDDSPADSAGIEEGDVIVSLNGKAVDDADDLMDAMRKLEPNSTAQIGIDRMGEKKNLTAKLSKPRNRMISRTIAPRASVGFGPGAMAFAGNRAKLGVSIMTLNKQLGEYFKAPNNKGVLIQEVFEESPAQKAGLKAGDVIVKIGKESVEDGHDVTSAMRDYKKGDKVPVEVLRNGSPMTLTVEVDDEFEMHGDSMFDIDIDTNGGGDPFFESFFGGAHDNQDIDIQIDTDRLREETGKLKKHIERMQKDMHDNVRKTVIRMDGDEREI